jgi:phosphatidylethanolamine/phosphatidyl-N-methylethanolamine N-methyltransferase
MRIFIFIAIFFCSCQTTKEQQVFHKLSKEKPEIIGAVSHSSSYLAQEITNNIKVNISSRRILEVGPGIGTFSDEIIKKMSSEDTLDLIELEPELCKILEEKYKNYSNVFVHCKSILEWDPTSKYDIIVSGLPFNSFEETFVSDIFRKYETLSKSNTELSFFEYVGLSVFAKKNVSNTVDSFKKKYNAKNSYVFWNFPPARVCRMNVHKA